MSSKFKYLIPDLQGELANYFKIEELQSLLSDQDLVDLKDYDYFWIQAANKYRNLDRKTFLSNRESLISHRDIYIYFRSLDKFNFPHFEGVTMINLNIYNFEFFVLCFIYVNIRKMICNPEILPYTFYRIYHRDVDVIYTKLVCVETLFLFLLYSIIFLLLRKLHMLFYYWIVNT
jgi:hypothetical protein